MQGRPPILTAILLAALAIAAAPGPQPPAAPAPPRQSRLNAVSIVPGIVTITADGAPLVAHQMSLETPYRLVVDIPASLSEPMTVAGTGSVIRMRFAMFSPGVARLVLDLVGPIEIVSAQASPTGLVLNLRRVPNTVFIANAIRGRRPLQIIASAPVTTPTAPPLNQTSEFDLPTNMFSPDVPVAIPPTPVAEAKPTVVQLAEPPPQPAQQLETPANPPSPTRARPARSRSGGKPLVVLDAGHGGKDVGAISINGGYEKDVALAIVKLTAKRLGRSGKIRVLLTRGDDRFIPLGGRATIARKARADLFISVHADSAPNVGARGASVYTLSSVASDAVAARLAARENKADIIGGVNLGLEAPEVGEIMIDLSRRATGNVSVTFAETLQDVLSDKIRFRGEFHHFAGLIVLKAPDVPSVLLETGYVTNSDDAEFLFSDSGRRKIADGIARAVERHLVGN
ncbi:N-acetylmuramoyl-L-alanine amidase [Sandarakinorhabdus glacialis]|uniref:N-acetylmuramoyl-L-alanine amidase n=1 Tax=Sandarakinorhabdus glacialis TaxID=1614636 RepID=UPI001FB19F7D|nr:N-acetylmuramoyl-L-alanine amidase [Polymorphobacter glacialis]